MRYVKLMLRNCSRVIALTAMVAGPMAQAADAGLTLACQGIADSRIGETDQPTREPMSFGVIVNLTARTVEGFPAADLPVKVTAANQATIQFEGSETLGPTLTRRLSGTIDRVTGEASATFTMGPAVVAFALKCRPAQRMF
jgi:hypothetical protein